MKKTISQEEIREAIRNTPLLSPSAARLLQLSSDPEAGISEVVEVVKCDAALMARILKIVNSAAFSLVKEVSSIDRAVSYLGGRMVVGIAIGDSAGLLKKPLEGYQSEAGTLWRHDLFAAMASRAVAARAEGECEADLAFTGGLLHDIGKALISGFLKGTPPEFLAGIDSGKVPDYLAAEQESLGLDHAQLGYELALRWNLPEKLQQMILHHHQPAEAEESLRPLVYAVHLGDILAMMAGKGTGADSLQYRLDAGFEKYFRLSSDELGTVLLEVQEEFEKVSEALGA